MQSAPIVAFLRLVLEKADAELTADATTISQYNIRTDGEVGQTYVIRAREQRIDEEAADDATVTVTIDDADFVALFKGEAQLVGLLADGKIEVSGAEEELAQMDENRAALLQKLKELKEAKEAEEAAE